MSTKYMQPYCEMEIYPGSGITTDQEFLNTARERGTTGFHMIGTCKMGAKHDPKTVVDDTLFVKGINDLRIADAAIMPTIPSANTNAACYLIGEKAAELI